MSDRIETYCSAVNEVVCGPCPIRLVTEGEWRSIASPDTTPYMMGWEVDDAISDATLGSIPNIPVAEVVTPEPITAAAEEITGYDSEKQDILDGLEVLGRSSGLLTTADDLERSSIGVQFGHCVRTIVHGECEIRPPQETREEVASPFVGLIDRQMGAEMLQNVARHGSADDVADMAGRILAWAKTYGVDSDVELNRDEEMSEIWGRVFLMQFAARMLEA